MIRVGSELRKHAEIAASFASKATGTPVERILGRRQDPAECRARHMAWWLLREGLDWSLPRIAKAVGRPEHTTIMSGVRRHQRRMNDDPAFAEAATREFHYFKLFFNNYHAKVASGRPYFRTEGDAMRDVWGNARSVFFAG